MPNRCRSVPSSNPSSSPVTKHRPFFDCTPDGHKLFAVQQGVPAAAALEIASTVLRTALDNAYDIAVESESNKAWATAYLLEMVLATMNSTINGLMESNHG